MNPASDKDGGYNSLDAFFDAADSENPEAVSEAAENLASQPSSQGRRSSTVVIAAEKNEIVGTALEPPVEIPDGSEPGESQFHDEGEDVLRELSREALNGKFIAIDPTTIPGGEDSKEPFVLIPARVYAFVPWWGWAAIGLGIAIMVAGIIAIPGVTLYRTAARLGSADPAVAQGAMRQLVAKGDERTVRKLYSMASSSSERMPVRLRAVDAMSLIERVPEVDRALLRLELSNDVHKQVREAAIAARKQREAYKSRGRR